MTGTIWYTFQGFPGYSRTGGHLDLDSPNRQVFPAKFCQMNRQVRPGNVSVDRAVLRWRTAWLLWLLRGVDLSDFLMPRLESEQKLVDRSAVWWCGYPDQCLGFSDSRKSDYIGQISWLAFEFQIGACCSEFWMFQSSSGQFGHL